MDAQISTRTRITAIPALLAAGALGALPGALTAVARQATPAAAAWEALGLPELNLNVTESAVEGIPETLAAGRYLATVTGDGEPEGLGITAFRLPEGLSLDEAMAQAEGVVDEPPPFYYESYLPGAAVVPAGAGPCVFIMDLVPGNWVFAGLYLSRPPVPVTVTGDMPADLPEPESTVTMTMQEMRFEVTAGALAAGQNLLRVENIGEQTHFVDLVRLPDGATEERMIATIEMDLTGTPSADAIDLAATKLAGSSGDLSPGVTSWVSLQLEPGPYGAVCFVPDTETGMPHAAMGMYAFFEIE